LQDLTNFVSYLQAQLVEDVPLDDSAVQPEDDVPVEDVPVEDVPVDEI